MPTAGSARIISGTGAVRFQGTDQAVAGSAPLTTGAASSALTPNDLGFGTMAWQDAGKVAITGGTAALTGLAILSPMSPSFVLAAPTGASGFPVWRQLVAADISGLGDATYSAGPGITLTDSAFGLTPIAATSLFGNSTGSTAVAQAITVGANLTLNAGTLSAAGPNWHAGTVSAIAGNLTLNAGTLTATGGIAEWSAGTVSAIAGNLTLNAGTLTATGGTEEWNAGTVSAVSSDLAINSGVLAFAPLAADTLLGNSGTVAAAPGAIAIGTGLTLAAGTLSASGGGGGATVETLHDASSGTVDCSLGHYFGATITGALTFTFTNAPAGDVTNFTLKLVNGGSAAITWPGGTKWANASVPTFTTTGVDLLNFLTLDGGTTWFGSLSLRNLG